MSAYESNHRFETKLGRAIIAIKVLDTLGLTVSHVELGARQPVIRIVHPHGRLRGHACQRPGPLDTSFTAMSAEIEGCEVTWLHDDELPPCVGEKFRDVLAERAIATLADWEDEHGAIA